MLVCCPLGDIFSLQFQVPQNLERYLFGECSVRELTESISFMTSERFEKSPRLCHSPVS